MKSPDFANHRMNGRSILFVMKAVRITAIVLGSLVVLYFVVISFIPEGMIVGIHFHRLWK